MATHFSILAWEIPGTEEPGGIQPSGSIEWDTAKHTCVTCCLHIPTQDQPQGLRSGSVPSLCLIVLQEAVECSGLYKSGDLDYYSPGAAHVNKSFDRFGLQFPSFKMNVNCSYEGLARLSQGGSVCGSAL